jgi:hypothetical protein
MFGQATFMTFSVPGFLVSPSAHRLNLSIWISALFSPTHSRSLSSHFHNRVRDYAHSAMHEVMRIR